MTPVTPGKNYLLVGKNSAFSAFTSAVVAGLTPHYLDAPTKGPDSQLEFFRSLKRIITSNPRAALIVKISTKEMTPELQTFFKVASGLLAPARGQDKTISLSQFRPVSENETVDLSQATIFFDTDGQGLTGNHRTRYDAFTSRLTPLNFSPKI